MKSADPSPCPEHDAIFESLLGRAVPAPLERDLLARLQQACPPAAETAPMRQFPWRPLSAAAALALSGWALAHWREAPAPLAANASLPAPALAVAPETEHMEFYPALESRQQLLSVRDLGVMRDSRERAVRLMSTTWLDENTYGDPGEKPALRESRFRHEIVPVLLPTY